MNFNNADTGVLLVQKPASQPALHLALAFFVIGTTSKERHIKSIIATGPHADAHLAKAKTLSYSSVVLVCVHVNLNAQQPINYNITV